MTKLVRIKGTRFSDLIDYASTKLNLDIHGNGGNDTIIGGSGNDLLSGGKGNDVISGGNGNDRISGGTGNDTLSGGGGNDKIAGDKGNDIVSGGTGNDKLQGGNGNDTLSGGAGVDDIDGGKGTDVAVYQGRYQDYVLSFKHNGDLKGTITDTVSGRDGSDTVKNVEYLQFSDAVYDVANDVVYMLNHAPTVSGPVTGNAVEDGASSTLNALAKATDADQDVLSVVSVPTTLPAGVTYSAANHTFTLDPKNAAYQHLAQGQSTTVTVSYGVSDGSATTTASVSWTISGTNDAPVVSGVVTGSAVEDGSISALNALAKASDVDDGTILSVTGIPALLPAGVSYDAGSHSFSLNPSDAAYQHLANGQTTVVSVSYGVSDGIATTPASVSWTVVGTNDAPVVSATVQGVATEDGAAVTLDALSTATDADDNTALSITGVPASLPAGVTYNAAQHSFTLDPANAAYQHLAPGATTTVTVSYGVTDGTATTAASVSWTVTGTEDAPAISGTVIGTATEDSAVSSLNALATASDPDDGAVLSVVNLPASLPAGVSYDSVSHTFTLNPANTAYQHLAAGQTATVNVNYGVSDGIATTPAAASWTVTGANDAPVLQTLVPQGEPVFDETSLTLAASMAFTDVDTIDTHSVTFQAQGSGYIGTFSPVVTADAGGNGSVGLTYHLTVDQYEAAGGVVPDHQDYLVTLHDNHGGISTQLVSIPLAQILSDITGGGGGGGGPNNPPVITYSSTDEPGGRFVTDTPSLTTLTTSGFISFTDQDANDPHQFTVVGAPSNWGHLTATLSDSGNPSQQSLIQWQYTLNESQILPSGGGEGHMDQFLFTITDSHGGSATKQISIFDFGTDQAPVLQGGSSLDVHIVANGAIDIANTFLFSDVDIHDTHVIEFHGDGMPGPQGTFNATLAHDTVNGTGGQVNWTYSVDPANVQYLAAGETVSETFHVSVKDVSPNTPPPGFGFSSTKDITLTIEGVNDLPYFGSSFIGGNGPYVANFGDPDLHDTHTVSVAFNAQASSVEGQQGSLSAHIDHDSTNNGGPSGLVVLDYQPGSNVQGPLHQVYDVTIEDNHGGKVVQQFVYDLA